jgi:transposase
MDIIKLVHKLNNKNVVNINIKNNITIFSLLLPFIDSYFKINQINILDIQKQLIKEYNIFINLSDIEQYIQLLYIILLKII